MINLTLKIYLRGKKKKKKHSRTLQVYGVICFPWLPFRHRNDAAILKQQHPQ